MTTQEDAAGFLAQNKIAVVGASRNRAKYGNIVYRNLKELGYRVFAVNPVAKTIEDDPCFPNLRSIPEAVDAAIFIVPPIRTEAVVKEALELGIRYFWMQPGAESEAAVRMAQENGAHVVSGLCILR
jgi:uncharacterized protein